MVILLKPPQPACTGGCPIKTAATFVTVKRLAHGLLRSNVRVTTQRSAVVTRAYSGPKCAACRIFLNTRPNASKIMVSLSKYFLQLRERQQPIACLYSPYAISFIRGHCVYSGNQGTTGSCNGASAQAAIHLPNQNNLQCLGLPRFRGQFRNWVCKDSLADIFWLVVFQSEERSECRLWVICRIKLSLRSRVLDAVAATHTQGCGRIGRCQSIR